MPIYHKTTPQTAGGNHNTAEIDYHTSEAAKVKRTREQAYFNSYDFDAIEVLPYDDDEEDEDGGVGMVKGKSNQREIERRQLKSIQTRQQHPHQHQHQQQVKLQQTFNQSLKSIKTNRNTFMPDNLQQQQHHHHPLRHVNSKNKPSVYLQHISSIFSSKPNNNSNKPQLQQTQHKQHQQQHLNQRVGNKEIAVSGQGLSHDNKHLKLSSSETSSSSSTLSSSSIVQELLNNNDNNVVGSDVIAIDNGLLPVECTRDVNGVGTRTSDITNMNGKAVGIVTCTSPSTTAIAVSASASAVASTNAGGNGGNFLLPRAMLKYQSSTLNTQQGVVTGSTTGITNSMPLATNASGGNNTTSNNNNSPTNINKQQQQKIPFKTVRDVQNLDGIKGNNAMIPKVGTGAALRLQKTSSSSSAITSLASEDIEEEDRDLEENVNVPSRKLKVEENVLAKSGRTKASVRASSHQSHYSTDKSASSGYYSSNVCSTYSLEEHIYSEPTLDLQKLRNNAKENNKVPPSTSATAAKAIATATPSTAATLQVSNNKLQQRQPQLNGSLLPTANETISSGMRSFDTSRRHRYTSQEELKAPPSNRNSQEFSENLKILESSIENLDRHLKSYPGVGINSQDALVNYVQIPYSPYVTVNHNNDKTRSSSSYHQLPTIQESIDAVKKQTWSGNRSDDSLMDIDLDSFLLERDQKLGHKSKEALSKKVGVDNPTFLTEEQEENHYKCAKYINSCPEDAYRVESDIIAPARSSISSQSAAVSVDLYPKRYEEQIHFQNTRELLEDVRDKIRLLTQNQEADNQQAQASNEENKEDCIPRELHNMINTLKHELELYLDRMNQHSELEIRQLCTGLLKNQHIVKMKNAFEIRRSLTEAPDIYSTYEAVQDGIMMNAQGVPISIRQQITSIRCSSDPNFKMKRKSITEVFPLSECYVETVQTANNPVSSCIPSLSKITQLQKNLSYHKPVLEQLNTSNTTIVNIKTTNSNSNSNSSSGSGGGGGGTTSGSGIGNGSGSGDTSDPNDKESILDWHRKKPSIWEMYYGTNRIQQSLLGGKKNGMMMVTAGSASSPSTMCYPSSRPESDFTLDLPRAEQLRIKMEKEKKFRQRCRVITTFLSLVFFLLTVMVVSLVLTRGKRMFGSMI